MYRGKGRSKLGQLEYVTIEIQVSMGIEIAEMEFASLGKLEDEGFEHKKQAIRKMEDREGGLRFGAYPRKDHRDPLITTSNRKI